MCQCGKRHAPMAINHLYVFITKDEGGDEGVIMGVNPMTGHMTPMIAQDLETAAMMVPAAASYARENHAEVDVAKFTIRESIGRIATPDDEMCRFSGVAGEGIKLLAMAMELVRIEQSNTIPEAVLIEIGKNAPRV